MWHKCEQAHTRSLASNAAFICNGVWKELNEKPVKIAKRKNEITHTPYFRLATDSQSILFHKRHFSLPPVSLFALLFSVCSFTPALPLFFRSQLTISVLFRSQSSFFMTLFRCCESLSHALRISTVIWLYFDQCIDCSVCWFYFCWLVCFVFRFNTLVSFSFSFDTDAPKRYTCLASSKKIVFPSFRSLCLSLSGPCRTQNTQSWLFWADSVYV